MSRSFTCLAMAASFLIVNTANEQSEISVPVDAKFVVQVDVEAFRKTNLGDKLLKLTRDIAQEEIGGDGDDIIKKVEEALGFNPLEEIGSVTLIGSSFEKPEEALQVMLQLGKTTGNLEGLMLALPGYASEETNGHTIHSAQNGELWAYACIRAGDDGNKRIMASTKRSDVVDWLDSVGDKDGPKKWSRKITWQVPEKTFAQLTVLEFPKEVTQNDPPGNIVKMLKDVSLTLREDGEEYLADLRLTTADEKRAEQIQQLVQGLKAMVGLFENEIGDDEDAKMVLSLIEKVTVERDAGTIMVHAGIPGELILKFLREEADLPL